MTFPHFISAGEDGKIRDTHLPPHAQKKTLDTQISRSVTTPAKASVVVMWDDGYREIWDNLRPLLLSRPHQKHAFAIYLDGIDGYRRANAAGMTASQVATLAAEGHEICSHAVTENPHIKDLPATERAFEYDECKRGLEEITGQPVTTWVYPNGRNSRSVLTDREMYLRYERVMSNVGGVAYSIPGKTGHYVRRMLWDQGTHESVKTALKSAAESGFTVCISAHKPGGSSDLSMEQVEEVLDLIDHLGLRTLLPREAYPSQAGRVRNPGFEDGLPGWYIATSGTGAGEVVTTLPEPGMPGEKSLRLYSTSSEVGDWAYALQTTPVIPGETYVFSAAFRGAKTGNGGNVALRISGHTWDPAVDTRQITGDTQPISDEWQIIQMEFTPTSEEMYAGLQLRLPSAHGGEVFYDRVSFAPKHLGTFT